MNLPNSWYHALREGQAGLSPAMLVILAVLLTAIIAAGVVLRRRAAVR